MTYSGWSVDLTKGDLELLDSKTKKILTCNSLFHPPVNVARLYLKRCEQGRGLISVKCFVLSEWNGLWSYLEKSEEVMLKEGLKKDFIMEKEGKKDYDWRNETN